MTFTTYLLCFLAGCLGILFHIFAVKIPATKKQAQVANMKFTYKGFFQDELVAILASLLTVIILLVVLNEVLALKPAVEPYLKSGFVLVGYTGSSILIALLGKASQKINEVVNIKTDVADQVSPQPPPPPTV